MGLATLMEWAAEWLEEREPDLERRWRYATPLLLLALIPLAGNRLTPSRLGVTLDPAPLDRQYLEKADVVVLEAIRDQMGKRPIYFSRTVGPYADQFGLTGYLEGQGFVRKLHQEALAESDSIKAVPGLGYVNVPRTEALAFQVYHRAAAARNRPRGWVDRPSEGILATYGIVYQALAPGLQKL